MDADLNRWLKDDLRLIHMSAIDLNGLMFHPRYGGLCRRLVKFLAESTLCSNRYSTVYVKEEYKEALDGLAAKNKELQDVLNKLYNYARNQENVESELSFLEQKLDYLKRLEDLQQTSKGAMEAIVNRSNSGVEQVSRIAAPSEYLSDVSLKRIYQIEDIDRLLKTAPSEADISMVEDCFHRSLLKVNAMHRVTSDLYHKVANAVARNGCDLSPKKMRSEDLVALKVPNFKEVHLDMNSDEKDLKKANTELAHKTNELEQQVADLEKQFLAQQGDIIKTTIESQNKILSIFQRVEQLELSITSITRVTN